MNSSHLIFFFFEERDFALNAQPGSYAVTGAPATFAHVVPGVFALDAAPGSYAVTGSPAALERVATGGAHSPAQQTKLSLDGYGARKNPAPFSAHPVNPGTRLGIEGYPARPAGNAGNKGVFVPFGPHPVERGTRLGLFGYQTGLMGSVAGGHIDEESLLDINRGARAHVSVPIAFVPVVPSQQIAEILAAAQIVEALIDQEAIRQAQLRRDDEDILLLL